MGNIPISDVVTFDVAYITMLEINRALQVLSLETCYSGSSSKRRDVWKG